MHSTLPPGEFLLPLFPLPNVVFFPKTRMPLHVFEPRYTRMIEDALESEERFGIVLLRPGWETDYFGSPPIHGYGTLGTIEQALALDDGRYNILVRGDVRFRVLDLVHDSPYRVARVIADPEVSGTSDAEIIEQEWLAELSRTYLSYFPEPADVSEIETSGVDALTNALIMSLDLDVEEKQRLLEIGDVIARAERVGEELTRRIANLGFLSKFRRSHDPQLN